MKKKENHFLKIVTLESILFLAITCVGMFVFPFLEAKGGVGGQSKEDLVWQKYFMAIESLEEMSQANENSDKKENLQEQNLAEYEKMPEADKAYMEKVSLDKGKSEGKKIKSQKLGTSYIKIKKLESQEVWGQLEHDYLKKKITLTLYGDIWEKVEKSNITCVWKGQEYRIDGSKEAPILLRAYQSQNYLSLGFDVDRVFSYQLYQDAEFVYVTFRNPKEVFDKIVVIDAGHGGTDTGTYAKFGDWNEKDFNLDFAKRVEENWEDENIKLYFTRLEDMGVTLSERVNFANELQADLFVSLHCNSSDDYKGDGLEVLYKSNKYKKDSKVFAKKCLDALVESTGLTNRGLLDGNRIYIIRMTDMPTVLLELGFLSNSGDLNYLTKEENRKKITDTICQVIKEEFVRSIS